MIKTNKLLDRFKLEVLNPKTAIIDKPIKGAAMHRYGLELSGSVKVGEQLTNIIGWGTKESSWFSSQTVDEAQAAIKRVVTKNTPLILLSEGFDDKNAQIVIESVEEFGTPVVKMKQRLSNAHVTIGWYVAQKLSEGTTVHASLVLVNGVGVMITGKSGIGKSEAVLELIQKGHSFVSDDSVILKRIGNEFTGEPVELTKNLLESRGIGIINVASIYGLQSVRDFAKVELVVELLPSTELNNVDRLGNMDLKYKALNGEISKIQIPVENGRTISSLIEAATNVYMAKRNGDDPLKTISERRD